jgi:Holliday junction resolvasome RuvABC ATP-dependent DNA helicase subunit/intein/homing endonuclease
MKPEFNENDEGLMRIRFGVSAHRKAQRMLEHVYQKFGGKRRLPSTIPVTVPHSMFYGPGGCHAKGTEVLMFNGDVKKVENVKIGDLLMGPDSLPRKVLKLVRGNEQMYKITLPNKHSFVVNENHMLHLTRTKNGKKRQKHLVGNKVDITVKDYLNKSKTFKEYHKLYQPDKINFAQKSELEIDPYILGIMLGDGCFRKYSVSVTTADLEVEQSLLDYALENKLYLTPTKKKEGNKAISYYIWDFSGQRRHQILNSLKSLGLSEKTSKNKYIPQKYKTSSIDSRLEILAGLLDSDGHLHSNVFEFTSKSETLAKDVCYIARSTGFAVSMSKKVIKYKGKNKTYFRVNISGDTNSIPTRISRKKATTRKQIKNPLVFSFTVEKLKKDRYFGFTLDQDHLYLTADFLVHHNCGKTRRVETAAELMGCTEEAGTFIRLTPDAIPTPEIFVNLLTEKLSWDGYRCSNGCVEHTEKSGCIDAEGNRTCQILDPVNPCAPIKPVAVFIDEIHKLDKKVIVAMLLILLEFRYQYAENGRMKDVFFPKFTCFGATTDLGDLPDPLITRFGNQIEIEYYTDAEMHDIILSMARGKKWKIEDDAAKIIGLCSQGVARQGENHLRGVYEASCYYRDLAQLGQIDWLKDEDFQSITLNLVLKYISIAKYLPDGLKLAQVRALQFLYSRGEKNGKRVPAGEQAICDCLGIDRDLYRSIMETTLISRGLIERTGRGRSITTDGMEYLSSVKRDYPELIDED